MQPQSQSFGKNYDILILVLSLYVVFVLFLTAVIRVPVTVIEILEWIDLAICLVFLFDWIYFFVKAEDRIVYFKQHLIDLIGSIPLVQILRPLRICRVIRLVKTLRLVRGLKGSSNIVQVLLKNPARSALTVYICLTGIVYFYCSLGLYTYEYGVNKNIHNFGDILWMSFTTLSTVGYGDLYPVTFIGRILAVVLVITGMGLFGLVTAEIATLLLRIMKVEKK